MKKYSLDDIKEGMIVKKEQLSEIYGVWVYFDNYTEAGGKIICISKDRVSDRVRSCIRANNNVVSSFYQDPIYSIDGEVVLRPLPRKCAVRRQAYDSL